MADLKKLDDVIDQLGVQSQKLMKFSEIYAELDKIKADLEANINAFASTSEELSKSKEALNKETKKLGAKMAEIQGGIMQRIDLIEEINKKFQRDLESDMTSKLNKHQSDFEVTVRAEGKATADTIENKLNTTFLKEIDDIKNKTNLLVLLAIALLGLNIYLMQ